MVQPGRGRRRYRDYATGQHVLGRPLRPVKRSLRRDLGDQRTVKKIKVERTSGLKYLVDLGPHARRVGRRLVSETELLRDIGPLRSPTMNGHYFGHAHRSKDYQEF